MVNTAKYTLRSHLFQFLLDDEAQCETNHLFELVAVFEVHEALLSDRGTPHVEKLHGHLQDVLFCRLDQDVSGDFLRESLFHTLVGFQCEVLLQ